MQPLPRPGPVPKAPRPITWWTAAAAIALIGLSVWGVYAWLSTPVDRVAPEDAASVPYAEQLEVARLRIEVIRNALTVGAGLGGVLALALAFRRQHHAEHQQRHLEYATQQAHEQRERDLLQREQAARAVEGDALQRRITDLRIQAVGQLGHDRAAVRIGGLHNLERLGSMYPELRQTVLDEICAYLRMPFDPRPAKRRGPETDQEQQVREVAQSLLIRHLDPARDGYWEHGRLDLGGALLFHADFSGCRLRNAVFRQARFTGSARFNAARFEGFANFHKARFEGNAWFDKADFADSVVFTQARFERELGLRDVALPGRRWFEGASVRKSGGVRLPKRFEGSFAEREDDPERLWYRPRDMGEE